MACRTRLSTNGCLCVQLIRRGKVHTTEEPLVANGRQLARDDLHALVRGILLQGAIDIGDVHLSGNERRQAGHPLGHPAELEFFILRGLAPVVFHPLVEHVRAHLALDKLKGARAHHLLAIEFLTPGVPARFALHHQITFGGEAIDEFRRDNFGVDNHLMIIDDLHHLLDFFRYLLYRVGLPYAHQRTPQPASVCTDSGCEMRKIAWRTSLAVNSPQFS